MVVDGRMRAGRCGPSGGNHARGGRSRGSLAARKMRLEDIIEGAVTVYFNGGLLRDSSQGVLWLLIFGLDGVEVQVVGVS